MSSSFYSGGVSDLTKTKTFYNPAIHHDMKVGDERWEGLKERERIGLFFTTPEREEQVTLDYYLDYY